MCDCCYLKCVDCDRTLPVHIADFCTERANVLVRCRDHRPQPQRGWVKFANCRDEGTEYGTWFMTVTDPTLRSAGHGVGEDGGIHPNTDSFDEGLPPASAAGCTS
ncbi:hypothetical protein LLH23_15740 [bacterium]|nr:hypothetical protein [bacterium]